MLNFDLKKILTVISGISLLFALVFGWLDLFEFIIFPLYAVSIISGGYFVFTAAVRGIIKQKFLNIDFLVIIRSEEHTSELQSH